MIAAINNSVQNTEMICDSLVGRFVQQNDTLEYVIQYDHYSSCSLQIRDFCVLEKKDCTASKAPSPDQLKCPEFGRNRKCEKFTWQTIELAGKGVAPVCLTLNINQNTSHNINLCDSYSGTRIWLQNPNHINRNQDWFGKMVENFKGK